MRLTSKLKHERILWDYFATSNAFRSNAMTEAIWDDRDSGFRRVAERLTQDRNGNGYPKPTDTGDCWHVLAANPEEEREWTYRA